MSYNAVLRKENAEVFGRVSLSTLETLPKAWDVMYGEKFIPKTTDTKTLLSYNKFPLSVYTVPVEREIIVRTRTQVVGLPDKLTFSVSKDTTVKALKRLIREKYTEEKIRFTKQILYLDKQQLEDFQTVENFIFQRICTLYLESDFVFNDVEIFSVNKDGKVKRQKKIICEGVNRKGKYFNTGLENGTRFVSIEELGWKRKDKTRAKKRSIKIYDSGVKPFKACGAGGSSRKPGNYRGVRAVDLKAEQVEGKGVPVRNKWEGYSYGLTIFGTCLRKSCPSHKIALKQTSHRAGYGIVRIDMNRQTFYCPACRWQFLPENFVVCNARALFRFKKTGSHLEVETSLLQSFRGINEYVRFNDEGGDAEYDWIEIKTVKKVESVHICSRCDMPIRLRIQAALFDCGHPVHRSCMKDDCRICNVQYLSETEVQALANRATDNDGGD